MPVFRCGHASAAAWRQAARVALRCLQPVPAGSNLGFLYMTDHLARDAGSLLEFFRRETGVADWVGTVGMGVLSSAAEHMDVPAVSVMVGAFPEESFRVFSGNFRPPGLDERTASGKVVSHHALIHADPQTPDMADLVADMSGKVASGLVTGGLSSSRGSNVQIANELLHGGLSGVVFSGDIDIRVGVTQGCSPLKNDAQAWLSHQVTASRGNVIEALDERPALDVFIDDMGGAFDGDLRQAARTHLAGLTFPDGEASGFVARNIVGFDPRTRMLAVAADIEPGSTIMFCRRDAQAAREDLVRMARGLAQGLDGPPGGGIYVSCIARGANMFGTAGEELKVIHGELGEFPLAGFFANGEVAGARLYAYTGVLTLFA